MNTNTLDGKEVNYRAWIKKSRERCSTMGLNSSDIPIPLTKLTPIELKQNQIKYNEVISVVQYFGEKVQNLLSGTPILILISDHRGFVTHLFGDQIIKEMMVQLGIDEGIQLKEEDMGTNVVNLALENNAPLQIIGNEHFHEVLSSSACYCVPFQFQGLNNLSGAIALMTATQFHSPFTLPLLANMIDSMDRELILRQHSRHQAIIKDIMINTMNNGVIITDSQGIVLEINQSAESLTNRSRDSIIGAPVYAFEQIGNYIYEVLKNKKRFQDVELIFTNSLSKRSTFLFDAMPIFNDQRMLIGGYAQFRDITERCELEKQILTAEKFSAIGKLGAGLAHEIRNPLTAVMGFFYLFRERSKSEYDLTFLNLIYSELKTMEQLITDFVLMAKPSSPDKKPFIIEDLIHHTIRFMDSQAILNNCQLDNRVSSDNTSLYIDSIQIKQVLVNLIQNAIESMPYGGTVTLTSHIEASGGLYFIHVADNGVGMTDDEMNEVLNPFFTTKEAGLGLGLSLCYRIIENHKGKLTFTSQKGFGTTFTIELPIKNKLSL
jgi:two-component system, sporulation sensor kinase E